MTTEPDLFTLRYPAHPGHKGDLDTGVAAARDMAGDANALRMACLEQLEQADLTADEIADRLGRSILSIRPRISELRARGLVEPTDQRRRNRSGKNAAVWRGNRGRPAVSEE